MKLDILEIENFVDKYNAERLVVYRMNNSPMTFKGDNNFFANKSFPLSEIPDKYIQNFIQKTKYKLTQTIEDYFKPEDTQYVDFTDVVKWQEGDYMDLHGDNAYYPSGEPNYVSHRTFTGVIYLNDNYKGGETFFVNDKEYKPKAGTLIAYPSTIEYAHGVKEIKEGTRCTLAVWFTDDQRHYEF